MHCLVPGLARKHLDPRARPWLRRSPTVAADLVCTFPASIETVEATLLTGREPRMHARWQPAGQAPEAPADAIEHHRDDRLLDARRAEDADAVERALRALADQVDAWRDAGHDVVVSGGPSFAPAPRRVVGPAAPDFELGSLAVLDAPPSASERDAWLATPGVAQVLSGDALQSWRAPAVGSVLVAEPGWRFGEESLVCGRRDLDGTPDGAILLAWNPDPARWPRAIHDLRVGPTLAARADHALPDAIDSPLPWT